MLKEILEGRYDSYEYDANPMNSHPLGQISGICVVKGKNLQKVESALRDVQVFDASDANDYMPTWVKTEKIGGKDDWSLVRFETIYYGMDDSKDIKKEFKTILKGSVLIEMNESVEK